MADPLTPQDIARRTFDVGRRGYEQQEVRGFLHEVSALVERLLRSESELRERAERAEARLGKAEVPDEAMLLEVLGEETTRVLTSAREAAGEIRAKSEASAERIIAEATSEAAELRSNAIRDADALVAQTKAESESILEAARTELDRRSAEADDAAARIREEGEAHARTLREEGQTHLARSREEAEAAVEAARQQGREMVAEAQAVRERVLRDLAVRRKRARQQVEKLNAGRERLLQAYEVVRRTIDEATDELKGSLIDARIAADAAARRIEEEPEQSLEQLDAEVAAAGLADLPITVVDDEDHDHDHEDEGSGPLSGEVPATVVAPEAPAADSAAPTEGAAGPDDAAAPEAAAAAAPEPPVQLEERRTRKGRRKKGFEGLPPGELTVVQPPSPEEGVRILAEPTETEEAAATEPRSGEPPAAEEAPTTEAEPAAATDAGAAPSDEQPAAAEEGTASGGEPPKQADDVFARLRADRAAEAGDDETTPPGDASEPAATEPEAEAEAEAIAAEQPEGEGVAGEQAEPEPVVEEPSAESAPFLARAAAVAPVEKELARRVKRALADEQNEVLDLLRRAKPKGVDDLLPAADDHAGRWADVVASALAGAASAGADWSGGTATSTADLADEMARGLTAPLRERIDRSFAASDGNLDDVADRVRALYREWKGQRLTEATRHFAAAAYARGVFDGIEAGSTVRWTVDPGAGACPDCDDNVLAGAITKGDEFPTGNPCAPAHPGCHCLVLAVTS